MKSNGNYAPRLLQDEEILEVTAAPSPPKIARLSSVEALCRLTGVTTPDQIGDNGPSLASLAITDETGQGLYDVVFGRDSLAVARFTQEAFPKLMRATLIRLAELQGVRHDLHSREEPGKIVHEARTPDDPIAVQLTEERNWQWPYYGSVDATPTFVNSMAQYLEHDPTFLDYAITGKDGNATTMGDTFTAAVGWIEGAITTSPSGFIEYKPAFDGDTENHVWMDSPDSYHHKDGSMANHHEGIAAFEVQTAAYDALCSAAHIYRTRFGKTDEAARLERSAASLYDTIHDKFWVGNDRTGFFVPGLDYSPTEKLRQMQIRRSTMGRALDSGVLEGSELDIVQRRRALVRHLGSPALLGASGIMTLAVDEHRHRPGAYHNGSVWPWDTHIVTEGMRRYEEFRGEADAIDQRMLRALGKSGLLPEYLRGGNEVSLNTHLVVVQDPYIGFRKLEQPPQYLQAWTAAAAHNAQRRLGWLPHMW